MRSDADAHCASERGRRFGRDEVGGASVLSLRLPVRTPFAYEGLFGHLAASAVPGVEEVRDGAYRRTLRLPNGNGIVSLTPQPDHVRCELVLDDFRDLSTAIARCRRLLDLDADPEAVVDALGADADLSALVAKAPGQRIPRTVDEQELALRVVLGQQVSIKAARTHAGRLVEAYGQPVDDANGGLTHVFPAVEQLAEIDPAHLAFPKSRQRSFITLIGALADGDVVLDAGCDWNRAREQLLALPGIGPWTAEVIAMRGLGDPDAFPVTRPRGAAGRRAAGPARRSAAAHRAQHPLAAVAVVRDPASVDSPRSCGQRMAAEGEVMETLQFRTIDSPVGTLTLAGRDGRLRHLRMVDQTYEPSRDGWEPDDDAFPDAVEQLEAYFAGDRIEFDLDLDLVGTRVSATGLGGAADDSVRRDAVIRRDRRTDRIARRAFRAVGTGQWPQSDRHHRAVPSGDRIEWQPHRIRRRNGSEKGIARHGEEPAPRPHYSIEECNHKCLCPPIEIGGHRT